MRRMYVGPSPHAVDLPVVEVVQQNEIVRQATDIATVTANGVCGFGATDDEHSDDGERASEHVDLSTDWYPDGAS